jgi:SAM-dependent methyltransferase
MNVPSLLRLAEHEALESITLSGSIIDIGGDVRSDYLTRVQGTFTTTRVNIDPDTRPDILHDVEKPLPCNDASFDGAVLFNILEHIYHYRELLHETARIVMPGGTIVVVVPFLFPVHPSPDDFHRFTASTLEWELTEAGFTGIHVRALGGGVWSARYLMLDRLLPSPVRFISFYTGRYLTYVLDVVTRELARLLGKKYNAADYALGYCVTATKA